MRWTRTLLLAGFCVPLAACATVKYSADYDHQATFEDYKTYDWLAPTEDERAALERVNPFLERRLQRAVDAELANRGFVRTGEGEVDFWVSVYPLVPSREEDRRARRAHGHVSVGLALGFGYPYRYGYPFYRYRYPYFGYRYPYWGYPYVAGFGFPYFAIWYPFPGYSNFGWGPGYGSGYYSFGGYGYPAVFAVDDLGPGTIVVDVTDARSEELAWRGWAEGALLEVPSPDRLAEYADEIAANIMKGFPPSSPSQ